jgi:hypothetical protein
MAITESKFRAYYGICQRNKLKKLKELGNQEIIKIALEEYDVNLSQDDIKLIKKNWESLMWQYIH